MGIYSQNLLHTNSAAVVNRSRGRDRGHGSAYIRVLLHHRGRVGPIHRSHHLALYRAMSIVLLSSKSSGELFSACSVHV